MLFFFFQASPDWKHVPLTQGLYWPSANFIFTEQPEKSPLLSWLLSSFLSDCYLEKALYYCDDITWNHKKKKHD